MEGSYTNTGIDLQETQLDTAVDIKQLERQDSNNLLSSQRITFSWSNLCVEVPGGSNRKCCGILPSKEGPSLPRQIIKNGKV